MIEQGPHRFICTTIKFDMCLRGKAEKNGDEIIEMISKSLNHNVPKNHPFKINSLNEWLWVHKHMKKRLDNTPEIIEYRAAWARHLADLYEAKGK